MSISHELRTPLTTMKGYAEALADGVIGADGAQRAGPDHAGRVRAPGPPGRGPARARPAGGRRLPARDRAGRPDRARRRQRPSRGRPRCAAVGVVLRTEMPAGPGAGTPIPAGSVRSSTACWRTPCGSSPHGAPVVLAVGAIRPRHATASSRSATAGPASPTPTSPSSSSAGRSTSGTRACARSAAGSGSRSPTDWCARLGGHIEAGHAPEGGARMTVRLPR